MAGQSTLRKHRQNDERLKYFGLPILMLKRDRQAWLNKKKGPPYWRAL